MKRFITLSTLVCMFFLSLTAQEVKLTIETTAGGLKDAMTEEQKQTVTDLTLTGSMNDADFYLIRDYMPKLKYLDMKQVDVDTIPKKAFYENLIIYEIILPLNIKFIGDEAFWESKAKFYITGSFPKLGNKAFNGMAGRRPYITEDNASCISVDNSIYSSDGKILYYYYDAGLIPEGTEVVAERAFDCSCLENNIIFPSTLKRIEKCAFKNTEILVPVGSYHHTTEYFSFKSENPPVLAEDAFVGKIFHQYPQPYARVPKDMRAIYKNSDPQWSAFKYILEEGEEDPGSINPNTSTRSLTVVKNETHWVLKGESMIKSIDVFTPSGKLLDSILCDNTEACLPATYFHGIRILKVQYENGQVEVIKLTN